MDRNLLANLGRSFIASVALAFGLVTASWGQAISYTFGTLSVDITISNSCSTPPAGNGSITFKINSTEGGVNASLAILGPVNLFPAQNIPAGGTFVFNPPKNLPPGPYRWILGDGTNTIGSLADPGTYPDLVIRDFSTAPLGITKDIEANNTSCVTQNGQVQATITGGSKNFGFGSYTYSWSSSNGTPTANGTTAGAAPLNLATLLGLGGLRGGTYTLLVQDKFSSCSTTQVFTITDPSPTVFTITTASPLNICAGDNITITLNNSEVGVTYEILKNVASLPTPITFPGTGSGPFVMTFPATQFATGNNISVKASNGFCTPVLMTNTVTLNINPLPTVTLGANPSVCAGSISAPLPYTATTGSPSQYSIDFDPTAEAAGFLDIVNAPLPASPISIAVPIAAAAGVYNATVTVRNSVTSCSSTSSPITITVVAKPTITLGANPSVCLGTTTSSLPYTATTGSPNQYSIDFNAAANAAGFLDVVNQALLATPIGITIPGAAGVGTYNATITVMNTVTGCVSTAQPITVTIAPNPTITLGASPSVCAGSTSASLPYTATTGTPDQYSIDFNAAANAAGFADVVNVTLGATPITITVPAAAAAGVYNATITVRNSVAGCVSPSTAITVTVLTKPTITLGANPSVCAGSTSASLPYSAVTGGANEYSIDFDATANAAGFLDVVNSGLGATPITIAVPAAAAAGVYNATLTVRNNTTGCISTSSAITVTIIAKPTITLGANPSVCLGTTTANLGYTATTGSPNQYSIDFNAAANAAGFLDVVNQALLATPIGITVPGAAGVGTYNATLTVTNTVTGCVSTSQPITVTIAPNPTITLGANPSVCAGSTSASLPYTATTATPDQYSIDFNAAANAAGFADVVNAALPATPISIAVPAAAAAGVYNATLTVRNSAAGCTSPSSAVTVTVLTKPTITLGANPSVCLGTTTANLGYTATTGTPAQYSIDFDAAANTAGFLDVVNQALPASPIAITVPGAAGVGTYNATLTVTNTVTGCVSTAQPITVTIAPNPTITLGANPSVCAGSTIAPLSYSATTGTPNQYSIDFDAAANTAGFADVANVALGATPINITVPAAAAAGVYNATITVRNSASGCVSPSTAITVTILAKPTITLGANPSVCVGSTSADLPYSAVAGGANEYSIDFNAAANTAGFLDVVNVTLGATPITIAVPAAAAAGVYNATLTVRNNVTGCTSTSSAITVTLIAKPTITLGANPSVCLGTTTANLAYTATTGSPNQYSIDFNAAANTAGFLDVVNLALPVTPIGITVPGAAGVGTYNATLTVTNTVTGCVSTTLPITVTIAPNPTITLGANPSVCAGSTIAPLSYSATTGTPNQYSIDFDAAANTAGFADVVNVALGATPINITVPAAAAAGVYNATITVRNSASGCVSPSTAITVTILAKPTITLGANPSVCVGSTSADLPYSAVAGGANEYSIDFNAAANTAGFLDVVNAALGATPITIAVPAAAAAGVYNATLTVRNNVTGCTGTSSAITVTLIAKPTITLGTNPSVCLGTTTANLGYTATTGSPNQYSIDFDAAANTAGFLDVASLALPATPIGITVPGTAGVGTYNATLTVTNTVTGCVSTTQPITVTIAPNPTITLGANPSVCAGTTAAPLTYSATTGTPNQYSIDFDAAANTAGFADVVNVALGATPINITVPAAAAAGVYNATITVRNSTSGCVSPGSAITVTILATPSITLGANPSVCVGSTTANLPYSAVAGGANEYSIDFNAAANTAGFLDVVNVTLGATPITIAVPAAAAAGVYNATLTVRNTVTGCVSTSSAITVTLIAKPTITLATNPSVCLGTTTANLGYTATTGTPNQYSIDFDAAANAAGFLDVVNVALPATPIGISIPGAAGVGTYNATLTVSNTVSGCASTSQPITVTITPNPTITLGANPSVCLGSTSAPLTYSATTGTPDQYSIDFDAAANAAGFADVVNVALGATPITITVPAAAAAGVYSATLTVRNSTAGCTSPNSAITVTILAKPTITLGTNPTVCIGSTTANLPYTAVTGGANEYSIDFNAVAEAAGFTDVPNTLIPATPIGITVPGAAGVGTYNATLTVLNTVTGCVSATQPITVTIISGPTITLSANPSVCLGSTTANLAYTATTGSPNQYSIDFDAAANAAGFLDVVNLALPATPISIAVPGAAGVGTYNATLTVSNTVSGCASTTQPITVTITPNPTITLGANPSVCLGSTSAPLSYSATTGTPDQYSIDFDAAANTAGFLDVVNITLGATPITVLVPGAAAAGVYNATLTVRNSTSGCASPGTAITVTILTNPTITLGANPSVCLGSATANLGYTANTGAPDQYNIDFDAAAEAAGFTDVVGITLPATPIGIAVPGTAGVGTYNATLTVSNTGAGCVSTAQPITITIISSPTITMGANPSVCLGSTTADLGYTATTGAPDHYSIDFNAAANAAGFVDIVNQTLAGSPIAITIPGAAGVGTYAGTLTVSNSVAGCSSTSQAIAVTIIPNPTITLGANPSVCEGSTSASLGYSATTGTPDQYGIDFDAAAEAAGFADVVNVALGATPLTVIVPGAATAGVYNATLTVRNSTSGCASPGSAITVTILANPTITLGANPLVCAGTTTADLPYSAVAIGADKYSIDFNAAAEAVGFLDVVSAALPATPIAIVVPGAAAAGVYDATLTVINSGTGCSSTAQAITVTISSGATVDAGSVQTICAGNNATLAGTFSGSTGITWTTSGDGTFNNANLPNAVYTPGANDIALGTVSLTITTGGPCAAAADNVIITITPAATVDAGTAQITCAATAVTLSGSFTGSATGLKWTTAGDGTFSDDTDPSSTYTPGVNDVTAGSVVLTATATGTCSGVTDNVTITLNPLATVDAGPAQNICGAASVTLAGVIGGSATSATWTGGAGTFTPNATTLNAIYTPTPAERAAGTVTLTLTTNNPAGPCPAATDNVTITIGPIPGDQVTFGNDTWIGYVYDDSSNPVPPVNNVDFASTKYRGFIGPNDIIGLSFASPAYNLATDAFNMDLSSINDLMGPNVCGNFLDEFSIRFKMQKVFTAGTYTFTVGGDDGVRLLIDNVPVAGSFSTHSYTQYTGTVCLTAGSHDLVIEYFEHQVISHVSFNYGPAAPPTVASASVSVCLNTPTAPTLAASTTDPTVTGFNWYSDAALTNLVGTGANFTPTLGTNPGELNVTTVGTTSYYVTAVYACGQGAPTTVAVNVVNGATLAYNNTSICEASGVVDLTTFVTPTPTGGTFTFSGQPGITGNMFDPSGLSGAIPITVNYAIGACSAPQGTLTLNVTNTSNITVPAAALAICQGNGVIDLNTLVSALPAGGDFVFAGSTGITGDNFDPTALTGNQIITVDYSLAGSCAAVQKQFTINVSPNATLTTFNSSICPSGTIDLTTLVTTATPAGGTLTFSGTGVSGTTFTATPAMAGTSVSVGVQYTTAGCSPATSTILIAVKLTTDPGCGGGGGTDCANFASIDPTITVQPSCNNRDAGKVSFQIARADGTTSTFRIDWTYVPSGTTQTKFRQDTVSFNKLKAGLYRYTITDQINGKVCGPVDFFLDLKTQVQILDKEVFSNVTCYGGTDGNVKLTVDGSLTGQYWYKYVYKGQESTAQTFTPGAPLPDGLPADDTDFIILKVDDNQNFTCPDTVNVRIKNLFPKVNMTVGTTDVTTCNGGDGVINVTGINGGNTTSGALKIRLRRLINALGDTEVLFDYEDVASGAKSYTDLSKGDYFVDIKDNSDCQTTYPSAIQIKAPGLNVTIPTLAVTNADCSNGGKSGTILFKISAPDGIYKVAISADPLNVPADDQFIDYNTLVLPNVKFDQLARGGYYFYVTSSTSPCPTRTDNPVLVDGPYQIGDFEIIPSCSTPDITIANISGEPGKPMVIQVYDNADPFFQIDQLAVSANATTATFHYTPTEHSFLTGYGNTYRFVIVQEQTTCTITSTDKLQVISQRLDLTVTSKPSFPNPKRTGSIVIDNIFGGTPFHSVDNQLYYSVTITDENGATVIDAQPVVLNPQKKFSESFDYLSPGIYTITVEDDSQCNPKIVQIQIDLDPSVYVPNIFTPNDDAVNDQFEVLNLPAGGKHTLIISNRWGNEVFKSNDYHEGNFWDAKEASDGIYFYRLQLDGGATFTGWVEVLRGAKP
jgi:gliding motility-associated-like protein